MRAIINDDITNISVDLYAPLVSEEFHAGLGILAWLKPQVALQVKIPNLLSLTIEISNPFS